METVDSFSDRCWREVQEGRDGDFDLGGYAVSREAFADLLACESKRRASSKVRPATTDCARSASLTSLTSFKWVRSFSS
jgi:hypothetical protein